MNLGVFPEQVSPLVSNIRNESPDCVLPKKKCPHRSLSKRMFQGIAGNAAVPAKCQRYDEKQLSKGIGRFFRPKTDAGSLPALCAEFYCLCI